MATGAPKPISYWLSFSSDKEIWRKWLQDLPSLFPIDFPLVLIRKSKGNGPRRCGRNLWRYASCTESPCRLQDWCTRMSSQGLTLVVDSVDKTIKTAPAAAPDLAIYIYIYIYGRTTFPVATRFLYTELCSVTRKVGISFRFLHQNWRKINRKYAWGLLGHFL